MSEFVALPWGKNLFESLQFPPFGPNSTSISFGVPFAWSTDPGMQAGCQELSAPTKTLSAEVASC